MPRLTSKFIGDITPPLRGQVIYRDDELVGFGVRATRSCKTYIVECRINGKSKRVAIGRSDRIPAEEAREKAQTLLGKMVAQRDLLKLKSPTLAEVLEDYISKKRLRERTIAHYREAIKYYLPEWTDLPVTSITEDMVLARHRQLGDQVSGMCANQAMIVLRMLLYHAARTLKTAEGMSLIPVNPVTALSKHRMWYRKRRRQGVIPDHKLADWYRAVMACTSPTVRDYLLFTITTGLRKCEGGTLRWADVDFEARILTIKVTKNHREHKLPLSAFHIALLSRRRTECGDSEYVFPGGSDGHIDLNLCRITQKVGDQCNCPFMIHDLRRSFVSMAAKLEVPHHLAKRLLNHIGQKDDTDEYIVISAEHLRAPMEQISQRFLELTGADPACWGSYPAYKAKYRSITLGEAMKNYLEQHTLTAHTKNLYRFTVGHRLRDWLELPVTKIRPEMVEQRFVEISTVDGDHPASKCQANSTMKSLQAILVWAIDQFEVDGKPLIASNPVKVLTQKSMWHYIAPRNRVVPDEDLPGWYQAVMALQSTTRRDLLLLSLFAGLCLPDVSKLTWDDVDLENGILTLRYPTRIHRLPLSDLLLEMFKKRRIESKSTLVFPGQSGKPIKHFHEPTEKAWQKGKFNCTQSDLRRTFLMVAQRLEVPHDVFQALANRSVRNSRLDRLVQIDVERLRAPMQAITDRLMEITHSRRFGSDQYRLLR